MQNRFLKDERFLHLSYKLQIPLEHDSHKKKLDNLLNLILDCSLVLVIYLRIRINNMLRQVLVVH